jgi:predicted MFS family arabinose efflux permease
VTPQERERWPWAAALALSLLVGIFPQFALGALGPQLREELGLTPADLGIAFTALYVLGVAGSPVAGPLADRIGGRRTCLVLLLLAGGSLWAASLASGRVGLVAAIVPVGAAMARANPGTTRWAAAASSPARRASLVGIAQAGVQAGALVAGGLAAASALGLDWRGALRVGVVLAAVGIVAAWFGPADPGEPRRAPTPLRPAGPHATPHDEVDLRRARRGLAAYALLMGGGTAIVFAYLPSFAADVAGFSSPVAGATTLVFGTTALICRLLLGALLRRDDQAGPMLLTAMSIGAAASIVVLSAGSLAPTWLWIGTVVFGATGTTWPVVAYLAVLHHSPPGAAGRLTGWVTAAFYLGLWATPAAAGWAITTVGYHLAGAGAVACYLGAIVPARRLARRSAAPARR